MYSCSPVKEISSVNNMIKVSGKNSMEISHTSGFYKAPIELQINHSPRTQVYYTTDGSFPDTNSLLYTEPINIKKLTETPSELSLIPTTPLKGMWQLNYFIWKKPKTTTKKAAIIRLREFKNNNPVDKYKSSGLVYFIGEAIEKKHSFPVISIITDKKYLFDYKMGIYVPGYYYDNASWENSNDPFWPQEIINEKAKDGNVLLMLPFLNLIKN